MAGEISLLSNRAREYFAITNRMRGRHAFMVGAQTPHYLVDYQTAETGVAVRLRKNQPLLLNSHYTNPFANTSATAKGRM